MPIICHYLAAIPLLLPLFFVLTLPVLCGLRCPSVPAVILVGVRVILRSIGWSIFSSLHIGQVFITWTIKNYINLLRQWQELLKQQLMGLHVQMCLHYLFLNICRKNFHKVDSMEYKKSFQIPILKYSNTCIAFDYFFIYFNNKKRAYTYNDICTGISKRLLFFS